MNDWRIEYSTRATADLLELDRSLARQILARLEWFTAHFDELTPEPLHGEWKGFYRFRIGDYRIIYSILAHTVRVATLGHRKDVYR